MPLVPEPILIDLLTSPSPGATNTDAVSGSMGADITSNYADVGWFAWLAIQIVWSAGSSPLGTVYVQGSNDGTNFENITGLSFSLSGDSGSHMFEDPDAGYRYVRVFYDRTSGDGTLDSIKLSAKG